MRSRPIIRSSSRTPPATSASSTRAPSRLAGITADTAPPEGGGIVHDEGGHPTGLLLETAQQLVTDLIPEPTEDELVEALGRCAQRYLAAGITSSADASVHLSTQFRAFQRAAESGVNPLRTTLMLREHLMPHLIALGMQTGFGNDRLKCGPAKLFIDGSLIGRTAAVSQPFLHDPDPNNLGLTMMSEEVFQGYVMDAHTAGWQIAVHAIGDRGIEMVLDAYEKALTAQPRADHRHRIEHCGILRPDLIARIAADGRRGRHAADLHHGVRRLIHAPSGRGARRAHLSVLVAAQ